MTKVVVVKPLDGIVMLVLLLEVGRSCSIGGTGYILNVDGIHVAEDVFRPYCSSTPINGPTVLFHLLPFSPLVALIIIIIIIIISFLVPSDVKSFMNHLSVVSRAYSLPICV